ncbi:hypothetical protein C362_00428 [Cryptococcus neoformans Bt1]|nr:hypothetical protein C362_00428 [Cryptococcus neoformans var. grubii Bt1]
MDPEEPDHRPLKCQPRRFLKGKKAYDHWHHLFRIFLHFFPILLDLFRRFRLAQNIKVSYIIVPVAGWIVLSCI